MSVAAFSVDGIPELASVLAGLPAVVRDDAMRKAIPPAGEMVRAAIAAAAPVRTGKLRGSITFFATQIGGAPSGLVKPDRRRGKGGSHAHLVEFGTAAHAGKYYGRTSQHPGTRARPFFQSTVDAVADSAAETMIRVVADEISTYWDRQGGR
jgi:HK97 gp10 family phage protein